jgi:hypothetical protein
VAEHTFKTAESAGAGDPQARSAAE